MGDPVPSSAISDATTGGLSVIVITGGSTGDVITLQSDGTYLPVTPSSGGITGSVGSTANRLVKSSGTGGSTVQATGISVDSSNNVSGIGTLTASGVVTVPTGYTSGGTLKWGSDVGISGRSGIMDLWIGMSAIGAIDGSGLSIYGTISANAITSSGLMCAGVYTFATVPSASSNTGKFLRISDRAQKHAYSDGTNWRFFGDDAIIS